MRYRSDQCKIGLNLYQDKSERGRGVWKLNSNILHEQPLCSLIKDEILLMIEVHAYTPYNPLYIKNFKNDLPELMITIELFWEVLLTKLRGTIIAYAAQTKRNRNIRENKLIKELENLDHLFLLNMTDKLLEQEINRKNLDLEEIRDIKLKGSFVRSRSQMLSQDEKPNKLFLNLIRMKYLKK